MVGLKSIIGWSKSPGREPVESSNERPALEKFRSWRRSRGLPPSALGNYHRAIACRAYDVVGVRPSPALQKHLASVAAAREARASVAAYFAARTVHVQEARVRAGDVYVDYTRWCAENRFRAMSLSRFGTIVTQLGYAKSGKGRRFYLGISLPSSSC